MAVVQVEYDRNHECMAMILIGSGRYAPKLALTDHRFDLAWTMNRVSPRWKRSPYYSPVWRNY